MVCALLLSLVLPSADFAICTAAEEQYSPCAMYANGQYYVFWADYRYYATDSSYAVFGARVSTNGTVIDPDGKPLYNNQAPYTLGLAYDGTNFLIVFRDSC